MSQVKFYKFATIGLILLNVLILSFFIFTMPKKGGPPPGERPKFQSQVVETLKLNQDQQKEFDRLAKMHSELMKGINKEKSELIKPFFKNLTKDTIDINKDELLEKIEKLEGKRIIYTYDHFDDLKATLDANQIIAFEELMELFTDRLVMSNNNTPPPRDGRNRKGMKRESH
jgi:hypothetical protein